MLEVRDLPEKWAAAPDDLMGKRRPQSDGDRLEPRSERAARWQAQPSPPRGDGERKRLPLFCFELGRGETLGKGLRDGENSSKYSLRLAAWGVTRSPPCEDTASRPRLTREWGLGSKGLTANRCDF